MGGYTDEDMRCGGLEKSVDYTHTHTVVVVYYGRGACYWSKVGMYSTIQYLDGDMEKVEGGMGNIHI